MGIGLDMAIKTYSREGHWLILRLSFNAKFRFLSFKRGLFWTCSQSAVFSAKIVSMMGISSTQKVLVKWTQSRSSALAKEGLWPSEKLFLAISELLKCNEIVYFVGFYSSESLLSDLVISRVLAELPGGFKLHSDTLKLTQSWKIGSGTTQEQKLYRNISQWQWCRDGAQSALGTHHIDYSHRDNRAASRGQEARDV